MKRKKKVIIQLICYNPRIYSGFDNFQIKLTSQLKEQGIQNVLVYADELSIDKLRHDITNAGGIIELVNTKSKFRLFLGLFRLFIKYKPIVVHSHFENIVHIFSAIISLIFRNKYFFSFWSEITSHSASNYKKEKGYFKYYTLKGYFNFLTFVATKGLMGSEAIYNQVINFIRVKRERLQVHYLGTEIYVNEKDVDQLKRQYNIPSGQIVITNISAIEHIKGIHTLIESLSILRNRHGFKDFICVHVGVIRKKSEENLSFYAQLKEQIRKHGLEAQFIWLEFVDDITDILKISDIYVHPSLQEGLGSANLEAATQGLPILGANVGGIPEIVLHGQNGFLFSSGHSDELAEHLYKLSSSKELRNNFGKKSYELVTKKFNAQKQIGSLINSYHAL